MTGTQRERNARRIAVAIANLGGVFLLAVDRQSFAIASFWLPATLKRRVQNLKPEILELLCAAARTQMGNGVTQLEMKSEPERRLSIN